MGRNGRGKTTFQGVYGEGGNEEGEAKCLIVEEFKRYVLLIGHEKRYTPFTKAKASERSVFFMKGYVIEAGYMGYVEGEYMLFANEDDYREYVAEC